jgi:HK97 family phage major capsid protein
MATRPISVVPPGTALSRYVQALVQGKGAWNQAETIAAQWRDTPEVALTLRTAVTELDTSEPLAQWGIARQFLDLLTGSSVVERLLPRMFRTEFGAKTPAGSVSPSVGWIGQGRGTPVLKGTLTSVTLDLTSVGAIAVISNELARTSSPGAESAVRTILVNALAKGLDFQFLSPTIAGISMINPSAITYNAVNRVSTGGTSAQIAADLSVMVASLTTWNDACWVMQPQTLAYLHAHNTDSIVTRDGSQSYLLGLPVYVSLGSPRQIVLVDIGHIVAAAKGVEIFGKW